MHEPLLLFFSVGQIYYYFLKVATKFFLDKINKLYIVYVYTGHYMQ